MRSISPRLYHSVRSFSSIKEKNFLREKALEGWVGRSRGPSQKAVRMRAAIKINLCAIRGDRVLDLSNLKLSCFGGVPFPEGLQRLDLSNNHLTQIDGMHLRHIKHVELRGNRIANIRTSSFFQISSLDLSENPLQSITQTDFSRVTILRVDKAFSALSTCQDVKLPKRIDVRVNIDEKEKNFETQFVYRFPEERCAVREISKRIFEEDEQPNEQCTERDCNKIREWAVKAFFQNVKGNKK